MTSPKGVLRLALGIAGIDTGNHAYIIVHMRRNNKQIVNRERVYVRNRPIPTRLKPAPWEVPLQLQQPSKGGRGLGTGVPAAVWVMAGFFFILAAINFLAYALRPAGVP